MKTPVLILDYSKYSDARLDLKGQTIASALTGNSNFPSTVPSLEDFDAARNAFSDSLNGAVTGDRVAISAKNEAREALLALMRSLAYNVQGQAADNRTRLLSSGFDLASDGESGLVLSAPADFKITDGPNSGEVKFSARRASGARSYVHEYTLEPLSDESIWHARPSTSRSQVFTDLPAGKRLYGRMAAVGSKGQVVYTAIISRVVQ